MKRILKTYLATMRGPDGNVNDVSVPIESFPHTPMLEDVPDALVDAQKQCAAKTVDYDSFNSDSDYLNTLEARAAEYSLISIRKPGEPKRFAYKGYVGENAEKLFTGPVLAVDSDEADFAARWGIALQAGILKGTDLFKDPEAFASALSEIEVMSCTPDPIRVAEIASVARLLVEAHNSQRPIADLIDELAALTSLIPSITPDAAPAAEA